MTIIAETVRPIVRDLAKAHDLVDRKFDVAYGNYTDAALLEAAFSGVDKLLFISTSALGEAVRAGEFDLSHPVFEQLLGRAPTDLKNFLAKTLKP